jgi:hypothetical protein
MTTDLALRRLRASNPYRAHEHVDAAALFAEITSSAPDHRLRATGRRLTRRHVVAFALTLALVAVVTSTALAVSGWFGEIIGPPEVQSEYARATKQLPVPPGYAWPHLNFPSDSVTSRGGGGAFAVSIAQSAWECSWVDAIRRHDAAGEQQAHAALNELMTKHIVVAPDGASENWSPPQRVDTPTLAYADDGGYQFKERMYEQAAAGRPALLEQSCRVNGP